MNKIDVINNLIASNKFTRYLEIGVDKGVSFNGVQCDYKVGVDPNAKSKATKIMTSNKFFEQNKETFDIVLIDGLHHAEQCKVDIQNAIDCLSGSGVVVVHDLLPTSKIMQTVPRLVKSWTGDVWKAWVYFRTLEKHYMEVYDFDYGVGVIFPGGTQKVLEQPEINISFKRWQLKRNYLMNVVEYKDRLIR